MIKVSFFPGSMDPYQRAPRSPRSKKTTGEGPVQTSEDCKSPTVDQVSERLSFYEIFKQLF